MIKRTIYLGSPAYLSKKNDQLIINFIEEEKRLQSENNKEYKTLSIPIEDIGFLILDNFQITITHSLMISLLENNCAIVTCNEKHLPKGMFLNLEHNIEQSQHFQEQINASEPLKKQLWKQTIKAKILNQAFVLDKYKKPSDSLKKWAREVKSGDSSNLEARASLYYWKKIFPEDLNFVRNREGKPPNNLLNYGYAILRAVVARGLVASGLLPTLGIHHHSKYNAFCLADDIMEPYRPFVDDIVATIIYNGEDYTVLSNSIKQQLLQIPALDVKIENQTRPINACSSKNNFITCKMFCR